MGMTPAITDRFLEKNSEVIFNQTRSSYHAGTIQALIKPLQNVIQVLIYCAGAVFAMTQGMNIGLVVAASIIMGRALAPLMQVMSTWRMTLGAREAYQRLKMFTDFLENQSKPCRFRHQSVIFMQMGPRIEWGAGIGESGLVSSRSRSPAGHYRPQRCGQNHPVPSAAGHQPLFRRSGDAGRQQHLFLG